MPELKPGQKVTVDLSDQGGPELAEGEVTWVLEPHSITVELNVAHEGRTTWDVAPERIAEITS
jgi:hypothetical protein